MKYAIIIATYNAEAFLERTLLSVLGQSYPKYELIVQDGASKDGTLDILNKYDKYIRWKSAPDTGIYDAWNKALEYASGDFDFAAKFVNHYNIARIPILITYMERGGISVNVKTRCMRFDERGKVLKKYILPKSHEFVLGCLENSWDIDTNIEL